ncbi:MAG TPA: hypothetical protein VM261_27940 [Kofleriaceae bacterium]|nr:hypothetical protein [Kofleriaceae bacterium]
MTADADDPLERERAAIAGQPYEDLFRAVIDWNSRIADAAKRLGVETCNHAGETAMMVAARLGRHQAMRDLVAAGARLEPRALVTAIAAGDLDGLRLLLDLGASLTADAAGTLRAACSQPDSDLLKLVLQRGIDLTEIPDRGHASRETERLVDNARAGRIPPPEPTASSRSDCPLCRDLPDSMGWCRSANGDTTGEELPAATAQFETFGWARSGVWKCPYCGTYHEYEMDHDNGIPDGWDSEYVRRISDAKALEQLRAMTPEPRIAREIAALEARLAFDEAIAAPGRKGHLSDDDVKDGKRRLYILSLGGEGATFLAQRWVPDADHAALIAALTARGLELVETDHPSDFYWVRTAGGLEVFGHKQKELELASDHATLSDGTVIPRKDIVRVVAYAQGGGSFRGVKAVLRAGTEVDLVSEYSSAAAAAAEGWPTYSRNELIWETAWCSILGHLIATWAGASLVDEI